MKNDFFFFHKDFHIPKYCKFSSICRVISSSIKAVISEEYICFQERYSEEQNI